MIEVKKDGTKVYRSNDVPNADEVVGGEAGKTFTTQSTWKVSQAEARRREDVGKP